MLSNEYFTDWVRFKIADEGLNQTLRDLPQVLNWVRTHIADLADEPTATAYVDAKRKGERTAQYEIAKKLLGDGGADVSKIDTSKLT